MDLSFTPDQDALRDAARRLTPRSRTASGCARWRRGLRSRAVGGAVAMGLPAMALPDDQGGAGASLTDLAAAVEVHGAHLGSAPLVETRWRPACWPASTSPAPRRWPHRGGRRRHAGLHPAAGGGARLVPGARSPARRRRPRRRPPPAASTRRRPPRRYLSGPALADVDLGAPGGGEGPGPSPPTPRRSTSGGRSPPSLRPGLARARSTSACSTPRTATSSACPSGFQSAPAPLRRPARPRSTAPPPRLRGGRGPSTRRDPDARRLAAQASWFCGQVADEARRLQPARARRLRLHARVRRAAARPPGQGDPPAARRPPPASSARSPTALGFGRRRRPARPPPPTPRAWTSASTPRPRRSAPRSAPSSPSTSPTRSSSAPTPPARCTTGASTGAVRAGLPRRRVARRGRRPRAQRRSR